MTARVGVGIIGAGPVTQAIHIPTLARLADRFAITAIVDIDPVVAQSVAGRSGATVRTSFEDLLQDPTVEVVAICTPPFLHAEQVIAALESGKRAVFCEKPLATTQEEAERIAEAAKRTGVPLIVGAMHMFDPAWLAVAQEIEAFAVSAHTVRSSIVLPFNERFEDWATEILSRPTAAMPEVMDVDTRAAMLSMIVLGLAVHDLPLVRSFLPEAASTRVTTAGLVSPIGYAVSAQSGDKVLDIFGVLNAQTEPYWELEVVSSESTLHIQFTPSFVHAGSGVATVTRADGSATVHGPFAHNGYEGEWRAIHDIVSGDLRLCPTVDSLIEDLAFVVKLAEDSAAVFRKEVAA